MEVILNSRHNFGQELFVGRQHQAGGAGEKSADSIYYTFRFKSHKTLKDREEGAKSQTSCRSSEHAQSHVSTVVPLALLDNNMVDSRNGVSTCKQSEVILQWWSSTCAQISNACLYLGSGMDKLLGTAARPQYKWSVVHVVEV